MSAKKYTLTRYILSFDSSILSISIPLSHFIRRSDRGRCDDRSASQLVLREGIQRSFSFRNNRVSVLLLVYNIAI